MARTARELTWEELRSYRPWRALERFQKDPEINTRWERAWEFAREAARMLKDDFGAARVVALGSLAHRAWFTPWSDVDLAVWGISSEMFYRATGAVLDLGTASGFRVDLIDPAECTDQMTLSIEAEGIEL
jgi:uncharacterized protein